MEVLDSQNSAQWLVRTKVTARATRRAPSSSSSKLQARPPQTGWLPSSYLETPSNYYKQRRNTRELDNAAAAALSEEQQAILKRE